MNFRLFCSLNVTAAKLKFDRFADKTNRALPVTQADTPVLNVVLITDENYCGPIGNRGKGFCNLKGTCKVASHKQHRDPKFPAGYYVEVKKGWVLHEPFVDLVTARPYEEQLSCFSNGAAKDIITGAFNTMKAHEKSKLSPEERREDLQRYLDAVMTQGGAHLADPSFDLARVVFTPQKGKVKEEPTGMDKLYPDLDDENLKDEVTCLKNSNKVLGDFIAGTSAQIRIIQGQLGRSAPVDAPITDRLRTLEDDADDVEEMLEKQQRKIEVLEATARAREETIRVLEQRLHQLEEWSQAAKGDLSRGKSDMDLMMKNVHGALDIVANVKATVAAKTTMTVSTDTTTLEEEMKSLRADFAKVRDGNQEFVLGGGSVSFGSSAELETFAAQMPDDAWHLIAPDAVTILANIVSGVVDTMEVQQQELHAVKVKRDASQTRFLGGAMSTYPAILVGKTKSDSTSSRVTLGAIATYPLFNKNNGFDGMSPYILKNLGKSTKLLELELMEVFRGLPEHQQLGKYLLAKSQDFIRNAFQFLENMRRELLTQGYGEGPYTATAEKEVWDLCLLMLIVVFDVLWETRGEAAQGYQSPRANFVYLHAAMKTHMEMERFIKTSFSEHPAIMPKLQRYIFETFVSKSDFKALQGQQEKLESSFAGVKRDLHSMQSLWNAGGGGGAGGGDGALSANQKRKLKQRLAKAQETEE